MIERPRATGKNGAGLRRWDALGPGRDGALAEAASALRAGRVILLPTESSHALAADASDDAALARIRAVKGRDADGKPLLLLCADLAMVLAVARLSPAAQRLARSWPAPLTLVLPARDPAFALRLGAPGLAVRVPGQATAREVIALLGRPVTGTSANRAGEAPITDAESARRCFAPADGIAGVLDVGPLPGGAPSTLVDLTQPQPRILREGAFAADRVAEALREDAADA